MNNYEQYLKMRTDLQQAKRNIHLAIGRNPDGKINPQNDKATFRFSPGINRTMPQLLKDDWTPAVIQLEMSYGYYGSSSGYRAINELTAYYVMQACNRLRSKIAETALELIEKDLEDHRLKAEAEARTVLKETASAGAAGTGRGQ